MATEIRRILGQFDSTGSNLTELYTVGSSTSAVASSIVICNKFSGSSAFWLSVAVSGAADTGSQYLYNNVTISANDTFTATLGLTLGGTDKVRAKASNASMSFNLFGVEIQ